MPGKNKPKRFDRNRAWRVVRRKKRIAKLVNGNSRNRAPRPKKVKVAVTAVAVEKKVIKKVVKKVAKKVVKKE